MTASTGQTAPAGDVTSSSAPPGCRPASPAGAAAGGGAALHQTLAGVVHSEWVKFRTLRSTWLTLLAAVTALIGFAMILGYTAGSNWSELAPEDRAPSAVLQGSALVSGQAILANYGHGASLTAPGAPAVIAGTGVYLALVGLLGSAIGWILRNTAGSISTYVGVLLFLPVLVGFLPSGLSSHVMRYLPNSAGAALTSSVHAPGSLGPWAGAAVLVAWVVAGMAVAAVQLRRRDA